MHPYLIDLLECPLCHGQLDWDIIERDATRIFAAQATCQACAAIYPVREGIALFLTPDLPRDDLWQQTDDQLSRMLHEQPDLERRLMQVPLGSLNAADQFFRALVLEQRDRHNEAYAVQALARTGMYSADYLACMKSQIDTLIEQVSSRDGPIVDLASGRCTLVEEMARKVARPIVASDFSPRVLRRDRRSLEALGLYKHVSLMAFDARRTPFKTGAIRTLTTFVGLPNIEQPDRLLHELRRIVSGTLLAISQFYSEDDRANVDALQQAGLATLLVRRTTLESFAASGWQTMIANACSSVARPTPTGVVLDGARLDSFPIAETVLEWGVLVAQ